MKELIKKIPIIGGVATRLYGAMKGKKPFEGSGSYWDQRYADGGNSGVGSYGKFAELKAEVLNGFVAKHQIKSVIEFGCGDGNQLTLAKYPQYTGFDVSEQAISLCKKMFGSDKTKSFDLMSSYNGQKADLTLSLDVIYHLVEDGVFEHYMRTMFGASNRYVIVYSSNAENVEASKVQHVRHRNFTPWVEKNLLDWKLAEHIPNRYPYRGDYKEGSFADFFIFEKV